MNRYCPYRTRGTAAPAGACSLTAPDAGHLASFLILERMGVTHTSADISYSFLACGAAQQPAGCCCLRTCGCREASGGFALRWAMRPKRSCRLCLSPKSLSNTSARAELSTVAAAVVVSRGAHRPSKSLLEPGPSYCLVCTWVPGVYLRRHSRCNGPALTTY